MLKLGKLRKTDTRANFERIAAVDLANLRGQVQAIGRSQAVIEFALDGHDPDGERAFPGRGRVLARGDPGPAPSHVRGAGRA